jgi:hypothetical protein
MVSSLISTFRFGRLASIRSLPVTKSDMDKQEAEELIGYIEEIVLKLADLHNNVWCVEMCKKLDYFKRHLKGNE